MKNVRVLIADDDEQVLRLLSNLLSDDFCVVGTVSDGRAMISAAVELVPHVIITDIDMPTMNGLVAVRQLEALMPDIKVIVLTGHEEPEFATAAIAAGASAFLIKNGVSDLRGKLKAIIRELTSRPKQFTGQVLTNNDGRQYIQR